MAAIPSLNTIGLGCSRFGSINGASRETALALLGLAVERGVRVFDTANIYGQGESEAIIGAFEAREEQRFTLITKVGQFYPGGNSRFLAPLKRVARELARIPAFRTLLRRARSGHLPKDFSPDHIVSSFEGSLARLGRKDVEIVLLHSPELAVLQDGKARDALLALKRTGQIGKIGVSCDGVDVAEATLEDGNFDAIQIPISLMDQRFVPVARAARAKGMLVIGREIFGGPRQSGQAPMQREDAARTLQRLLDLDIADVLLVGTTNSEHLVHLLDDIRAR